MPCMLARSQIRRKGIMNQNRFLAPFVFLIAFALGQESLAADRSNWKTEWEKTLNQGGASGSAGHRFWLGERQPPSGLNGVPESLSRDQIDPYLRQRVGSRSSAHCR